MLQRDLSIWAGEAGRVFHAHRWLIAYILVYILCALTVAEFYALAGRMSLWLYSRFSLMAILGCVGAFALLYPVFVMVFVRPEHLTRHIATELRTRYLTADRVLGFAIVVALLPLFFSVSTSFKSLIPVLHPFAWDETFAAWDRWHHGGVDPWKLLQPLLGHPWATSAVGFFYHLWFFVVAGILFWQTFSTRDRRLRMQFLLTFVLSWSLLGSLLAVLLSSGGPVYYGRLTGLSDPFAPLMDYLAAADEVAPVWALKVQDMLWESYTAGEVSFATGISAMPSMHVSATVLLALLGWRVHRSLGIALTAFAILIMIGSVHLGWHYAIDGYLAALLTWLMWRCAGWWVARDPAFQSR